MPKTDAASSAMILILLNHKHSAPTDVPNMLTEKADSRKSKQGHKKNPRQQKASLFVDQTPESIVQKSEPTVIGPGFGRNRFSSTVPNAVKLLWLNREF